MGIVYLAEQSKPVKRRVALKVIKAGMDTKQVIARFEAERQALARMNHAGIAQVYEAGATEQGRPYFVLEFVKGMPITEACDEHKLDTTQRLELLAKVCDAVQHAHTKGIIHRDLKPSNILVSIGEDDVLEPKIIDFGVAKATTQQLTDKTFVTQVGRFIGTPAYMSPEQADLKATDIDTRTDVYALGVVTYEVLTGLLPFDPQTLREAGLEKTREIISTQPPPKPSTRLSMIDDDEATKIAGSHQVQIATLAGILRKELEWIPLKALRKRRNERYDSPKSMSNDIRRYLNNEALEAGPETLVYKAKKLMQKHMQLVAGFLVIFFVFTVGIIVSTYFVSQAQQQAEIAEAARTRTSAMAEYSFKTLSPSMGGTTMQQNRTFWKGHIRVLQNKIDELFSNDPRQQASMYVALGRSGIAVNAMGSGGSERADLFQRAADILRTNYGYNDAQVLLYDLYAKVVEGDSNFENVQIKLIFDRIIELQPDNIIKAEALMIFAKHELGLNHVSYRELQQGHAHSEQAIRLFASSGQLYDSKQLSTMSVQIWSCIYRVTTNEKLTEQQKISQLEKGKNILLKQYLPLAEIIDGGRGNNYYHGLAYLASFLGYEGNLRESIDVGEEVLKYKLEILGDGHNSTWQTMNNLAISCSSLSTQTDSESEKLRLKKKALELMLSVIAQSAQRGGDVGWYKRVMDGYLPDYALDEVDYNEWREAIKLSPSEFISKYVKKEDSENNSSSEDVKPD
ncbi:MAG: serine/threonine protein kinase, partial [Phycisphaerae bacterium]|nr:serine/threonine protein kinase [Phycisphaerae bacterium]